MAEKIRLLGGPLHDQWVSHEGGDYYYAVSTGPLHPGDVLAEGARPDVALAHHVYRRAADAPHEFYLEP